MLRFLEPRHSSPFAIWERVFDGTYDKPFILDTGRLRYLHFGFEATQSAMYLDDPYRLRLAYTRKMMAFLLFNGAPHRILMLGLGGGSLAKFCYQRLPGSAITAVEVSADVIALRDSFLVPEDNDRFRVVRADSANYLARRGPGKDVILADACNRAGIAPELHHRFLSKCATPAVSRRRVRYESVWGPVALCSAPGQDTSGLR
jgi:spermidine synthase